MTDPYEELAAMRARLAELERFATEHAAADSHLDASELSSPEFSRGLDGLIRRTAGRFEAPETEPSSKGTD